MYIYLTNKMELTILIKQKLTWPHIQNYEKWLEGTVFINYHIRYTVIRLYNTIVAYVT